jgi:hypothetical protein
VATPEGQFAPSSGEASVEVCGRGLEPRAKGGKSGLSQPTRLGGDGAACPEGIRLEAGPWFSNEEAKDRRCRARHEVKKELSGEVRSARPRSCCAERHLAPLGLIHLGKSGLREIFRGSEARPHGRLS